MSTDSQSVPIDTEPESADCVARGEHFRQAFRSPAVVRVPRSAGTLTVRCEAIGYETAEVEFESGLNPWVLGNVFLGGLIGLTIDMGTDSVSEYPSRLLVRMEPITTIGGRSVSSAARERDPVRLNHQRVVEERRRLQKFWSETIEIVGKQCQYYQAGRHCVAARAAAERRRDAALSDLESRAALLPPLSK